MSRTLPVELRQVPADRLSGEERAPDDQESMPQQILEFLTWVFSLLSGAFGERVPETISLFQDVTQWTAIMLSALAAVYEARRRELDIFGTLVIAFVVSVGGGTLRDVLLSRYPIFWVTNPVYLITVSIIVLIGVFVIAQGERTHTALEFVVDPIRRVMRSDQMPGWVTVVDALGLGLWAYLGVVFALQSGSSWLVAPVFGVVTGSFGGVIRDVLFAQTPTIFKRGQLYSTSAAIGSIIYVAMTALGVAGSASFLSCVAITFSVRMASVRFNIVSI